MNPWKRRARQPTPVILAWRIPWTEEPGGLQSSGEGVFVCGWGCRTESDRTYGLNKDNNVPFQRGGAGHSLSRGAISSVSQSCPTLRPHGLQHARLPCPSPTLGVYPNSYPSNHPILCRLLLLLPSIFPSIRVFSNESDLHIRWPKYWSFIFSISPSSEYSELISFRMDWLDLL